MNRRSFITKAGIAGAAGLSTVAAPAIAQRKITWRMVTTWPKNFPGLGVGAQRLADRITAASGGQLTVQVFSAGELVPALQSIDAVIDGGAEMSHGAAYYWQNKSVALSFFTGVPFGMTSRELAAWVRYLGGQQIWDEVYDQFGLQGFLSGDTGTQAGGWFPKEIKSLEDVKGLRFRTPGLGGQVWGKMGASVTNMAAGEIFQALQSGALDGVAAIFGAHVDRRFPVGQVVVQAGPMAAAADSFRITLTGRGAHGARPHESVDPVLGAGLLIVALQGIVSRRVNPSIPAVLTVSTMQAGSAPNVIPETATIGGTLRAVDPATRSLLADEMRRVAHGIAAAHDLIADVHIELGPPPIVNPANQVAWAHEAAVALLGADAVVPLGITNMAGEDFAYYMERIPGAFLRIGAREPGGVVTAAHTPRFFAANGSLFVGAALLAETARVAAEAMTTLHTEHQ